MPKDESLLIRPCCTNGFKPSNFKFMCKIFIINLVFIAENTSVRWSISGVVYSIICGYVTS